MGEALKTQRWGWNKDVKVFANNGRNGTKGWVVGDNEATFWFVQCGSVVGRKCFCPCDIVNSLYFPLKHVCKDSHKLIDVECEGLVGRTNAAESKS